MQISRKSRALCGMALSATVAAALSVAPATTSSAQDSSNRQSKKDDTTKLARQLVKKADGPGANRHLIAFQRIADRNGGNRASGTPGYDASVDYVAGLLRGSGYIVTTPEYTYDERVAADGTLVVGGQTFVLGLLQESDPAPVGGVTAPMVVLPEDATTGCEASDFAGTDVAGKIVVIRRGSCTFLVKAQNAAAAGAVHVIISNSATGADLLTGTLGEPAPVPVGFTDFATGNALVALSGQTAVADPSVEIATTTSRNVVAQTRKGRTDNVVMAGAHLDSVEVGPGINDNGSGSAGLLEVALELGGGAKVKNAVRFAWWGAEELGLIGSQAYVDSLSFEQQLDIALYLNFDMIGSPNAAYFVYDGDDSDAVGAGPGPYGSAQIEQTFSSFFADELRCAHPRHRLQSDVPTTAASSPWASRPAGSSPAPRGSRRPRRPPCGVARPGWPTTPATTPPATPWATSIAPPSTATSTPSPGEWAATPPRPRMSTATCRQSGRRPCGPMALGSHRRRT